MTMTAEVTSQQPAPLRRRPVGPRRRLSMGWVLAAGAAFALAAVLVLWGLSQADERSDVLVVVAPVRAGQPLSDAVVGTTRLAADAGFGRIYVASQRDLVVGAIAATDLEPGDLLGPAVLTSKPAAFDGEQLVGLVLRSGRFPAELKAGDTGSVVYIGGDAADAVRSIPVRVVSVEMSETSQASVTVAVASADAAAVASWSGRDLAVLIVTPVGVTP